MELHLAGPTSGTGKATPIVRKRTRLSHILAACGEFSQFTDHKNTLYMLSPTRFNANVARHIVHKTQRWASRLAEFNFTVEHIPGELNTWADFLTRWAAPGSFLLDASALSMFLSSRKTYRSCHRWKL